MKEKCFAPWLIAAAPFLSACSGPQSALDPAGPSAQLIAWLWWGMLSFFTLVLLTLIGLWIYAMRRDGSQTQTDVARIVHRRWLLGGGLLLPLLTISVLLAVGIPSGQKILMLPATDKPLLRIEATAHRWWWEFHYPDTGITTANQLYLPVDTPVEIHGTASDVIHSFWIPRLGGKIDLIPGRTNTLRLQASSVGPLRGQCTEFCGSGHAHMIFGVEVLEADAFDRWQQSRLEPVVIAEQHQAAAKVFAKHCADCHAITGVSEGQGGPDLTEIGNRRLLGAGLHKNQRVTIRSWLSTHPTLLANGATPDHRQLAPQHIPSLAAWLETLGHE